jgi:hypothetical protein
MNEEASDSANHQLRKPQNLLDILMAPIYEADVRFQDNVKQLVEDYIKRRRNMVEYTMTLAFGESYVEMVTKLVEIHLEDPEKYLGVDCWSQETTVGVLTSGLVELHPTDDTKVRIKIESAKSVRK